MWVLTYEVDGVMGDFSITVESAGAALAMIEELEESYPGRKWVMYSKEEEPSNAS